MRGQRRVGRTTSNRPRRGLPRADPLPLEESKTLGPVFLSARSGGRGGGTGKHQLRERTRNSLQLCCTMHTRLRSTQVYTAVAKFSTVLQLRLTNLGARIFQNDTKVRLQNLYASRSTPNDFLQLHVYHVCLCTIVHTHTTLSNFNSCTCREQTGIRVFENSFFGQGYSLY